MNQQNTQKLFNDFPTLFQPNKSPQETLMCFGFECGDGWFDLIYKLCEDLVQMDVPEGFEVVQVKEKFGGMRFYTSCGTEETYHRIDKAEDESYYTCENCGARNPDGAKSYNGWFSALCVNCRT